MTENVITRGSIIEIDRNGNIVIADKSKNNTRMNAIIIEFFNEIDLGECTCCGKKSTIHFQGNIIDIGCTGKEVKGFKCILHDDGCPGKKDCVNKERFDPAREKKVSDVLKEITGKMFDLYDIVVIKYCGDSRRFIAENLLQDENYEIELQFTKDKNGDNDKWFVILKNSKTEENKGKITWRRKFLGLDEEKTSETIDR